ncbi:MAG: transposase [Patescibacteria group bacterium]
MRKEPFFVGDAVHVFNRGNRKQEIVRDDKDRERFVQMLYYFNDEYAPLNLWKSDFHNKFERPAEWPERDPLVKVHGFTLMDNHYHLVLGEMKESGITRFMQKLGTGMTNRFNTRHKETGRLFQGAYKARRIDSDNYLEYLAVYVHVKNVFELYPGGLKNALTHFDDAFKFAVGYPYSSLGAYFSNDHVRTPIIAADIWQETFKNKSEFKEFARNCIEFVYFDDHTGTVNGGMEV